MLALANQSGAYRPSPTNLLPALVTLGVAAVGGLLLLFTLERLVPRARRTLRLRTTRISRLRVAATAELRARAMMDELCPHGWQAEIVLFSSGEELPLEAPDPARTRVQLDWMELSEPGTSRRVWAPDVASALEMMVAERVTDETLQRIEQQALNDGADWPDI
jgi:hypothetical protein